MYIPSQQCPRREVSVAGGKGLIAQTVLAGPEELYHHGRLFAHVTVRPGCSIGDHPHTGETEFYYILSGQGVFNDNGQMVTVGPGDLCATGGGETHGLENQGQEPLELMALIVSE